MVLYVVVGFFSHEIQISKQPLKNNCRALIFSLFEIQRFSYKDISRFLKSYSNSQTWRIYKKKHPPQDNFPSIINATFQTTIIKTLIVKSISKTIKRKKKQKYVKEKQKFY